MSLTSSPRRIGPLLRTPGVAAFLSGRFLAATGVWCERIAIGWLIWDITKSPAMVGAAVFVRLAPAIVLSPLGGVLADRRGAVGLLRTAHAVNAAIAVLLAAFATALPVSAILACTVALGVVQALAAAPLKSVVPQVLARRDLPMAIPLSSATFNLAAFVGPAVAGGAIALVGLWAAFAISALGGLAFYVALGRWLGTDAPATQPAEGVLREVSAAALHVREDPGLRPIFVLHLAAACCLRPFIDLLPAYIGASGERGAAMLGLATSAVGAGALLGAVWMATSSSAGLLARRLLGGTAAAIACLTGLGFTGFSPALLPVVLVFGTAMVVRATSTLTLVQLVAPPRMRGRVAGLYSMTIRGGAAVGAVTIGFLGERVGMQAGTAVVAGLCSLVLLLTWSPIHHLRGLSATAPQEEEAQT